jgi:hypothetical protein
LRCRDNNLTALILWALYTEARICDTFTKMTHLSASTCDEITRVRLADTVKADLAFIRAAKR